MRNISQESLFCRASSHFLLLFSYGRPSGRIHFRGLRPIERTASRTRLLRLAGGFGPPAALRLATPHPHWRGPSPVMGSRAFQALKSITGGGRIGSLRPVNHDQGDRGSAFGLRPHHSPRSRLTGLPLRQEATRVEGDTKGWGQGQGAAQSHAQTGTVEHGEDGAQPHPLRLAPARLIVVLGW